MANIRVKCPTCESELEIDSAHEGQEVECGNCLQVFVAERPRPKSSSSASTPTSKKPAKKRDDDDEAQDRPRKSRRRRRDDDDDDYAPPRRGGGGNGLATVSVVLGGFSIVMAVCCGLCSLPLSIAAIVTGSIAMKEPQGKGMATAGLALGFVAIVVAIIMVIIGIGLDANKFRR